MSVQLVIGLWFDRASDSIGWVGNLRLYEEYFFSGPVSDKSSARDWVLRLEESRIFSERCVIKKKLNENGFRIGGKKDMMTNGKVFFFLVCLELLRPKLVVGKNLKENLEKKIQRERIKQRMY